MTSVAHPCATRIGDKARHNRPSRTVLDAYAAPGHGKGLGCARTLPLDMEPRQRGSKINFEAACELQISAK